VNIHQAFASKYFKALDIDEPIKLKIRNVTMEQMQQSGDEKPVMSFAHVTKKLVLNQVNAFTLTEAWGADTDAWAGRAVELYATTVQFGRERVPGIRVRVPETAGTTAEARAQAMQVPPGSFDDLDDEIPSEARRRDAG
jgi:hypothetical protein